ncbi:DUF883 domain containing protein [Sulfitobacter noctilucae]|uniref:DUF883 family protein n=1 Tax=Sulfitobacter noctilucae TaxID=1342302 RepID=UPI000468A7B1|nr:DUF883 family protein [Sulfitobacter noctilucae]KIN65829.1 DUF883 domain containing protein [Sulfitobacter noctilucae]
MATTSKSANGASAEISMQEVSEQIKALQNDLAALTSSVADYGTAKTAEVRDAAKETAANLANQGRDKALETQLHAEEFVRTQPATALGIAAGLGFLVGMFSARR